MFHLISSIVMHGFRCMADGRLIDSVFIGSLRICWYFIGTVIVLSNVYIKNWIYTVSNNGLNIFGFFVGAFNEIFFRHELMK